MASHTCLASRDSRDRPFNSSGSRRCPAVGCSSQRRVRRALTWAGVRAPGRRLRAAELAVIDENRRHRLFAPCQAAGGYPYDPSMGSAGRPSDADRDLSDRLAARGVRAKPGWLHHLRSDHEIPGPTPVRAEPGLGRKGGLYRYTSEAEDYAAAKLRMLALRPDLAAVNLTLFGAGWNPDERALRRAYLDVITRWQGLLVRERQPGMSPLDTAEAAAATPVGKILKSALGREMADRVRRRARARLPARVRRGLEMPALPSEAGYGTVETAITQPLVVGLSGAASSEEALDDFIEATGVIAMSEDEWKGYGPASRDHPGTIVRFVFKHATFSRLNRRIRLASMEELIEARSAASLILTFLVDARTVIRFLTPLPEAFGFALLSPRLIQRTAGVLGIDLIVGQCVPMILLISDLFPTQYRESVAFLSQQAPTYRAMASCVDSLPAELRGLNGACRLRRLPKTEQSRLIMDWASNHRSEAAILDIDPADAGDSPTNDPS
jgi:hypothetical protein